MFNSKYGKILKNIISALMIALLATSLLAGCGKKSESEESKGGSGPEKALEKYINATVECDGEAIYTLTVDPYQEDYWIEEEIYENKNEIIEEYKDLADDNKDFLEDEYGESISATIETKQVTKYEKDDIKALNKYLEESDYKAYNGEEDILQDIQVIRAKVTVKGSEDEESETTEYVIRKMKGKWYVGGFAGLYDKDSIDEAIESVE